MGIVRRFAFWRSSHCEANVFCQSCGHGAEIELIFVFAPFLKESRPVFFPRGRELETARLIVTEFDVRRHIKHSRTDVAFFATRPRNRGQLMRTFREG